MKVGCVVASAMTAWAGACLGDVTLPVSGQCNPWLAGMPDGTIAGFVDQAPFQSPVLVPIALSGGWIFTFSASGGVSNTGGPPLYGPDGGPLPFAHVTGAEHGISDTYMDLNSLAGVFLDDSQPDLTAAPIGLDFSGAGIGEDFTTLSPLLKQVFFIGDGSTTALAAQTFVAPAGATRLFLASMDSQNNLNNIGSFEVTVNAVPSPGALLLALVGLVACRRWR